ncbi:2-succinylbenzoate-CoA ligase [Halobacteriales archaeon QH_2_65_14]|nr:MAG: 2-succinylbenzoate-CoA ligase [Halobacteriales archaeon QH_2_65_14]
MRDSARWPSRDPLSHRVSTTPDRTALVDAETGVVWTYRELDSYANRVARELRERVPATESGDSAEPDPSGNSAPRIGLLLSPRPEFVTTLYGAWRLGWTVASLNSTLPSTNLETLVDRAQLDVLVCEGDTVSSTRALELPVVQCERLLTDEPESTTSGRPQPGEGGEMAPARWDADETALILFTSGTTGDSKGVRLTLGNLTASATASAFRLGVTPGDRWLCCLPVYHVGGLAPAVRSVLYGTTLVVQRSFDAEETAGVLDEGVTGVSLVPTQLKRLLDAGWTPSSALETVLLGGGPATDSLLNRAAEAGVPVYPTYGLTETASQVATARPEQAREHPGTAGQPLVCTGVTIVDTDEGEPVEAGQTGEIVVDGPTVTRGYLDETRTDEAFGQWGFHTGDVGYLDDDRRLWVLGRRDDMILTGGELVAPEAVRETLVSHPAVEDAAVVGMADDEWGERVAALLVREEKPNERLSPEVMRQYCRGRLADYELPKTIAFDDELPRTASGTVDREATRAALRQPEN